jgi:catechol 2,3-dioxygenase-like lactoylglutathione lyase family enzyme
MEPLTPKSKPRVGEVMETSLYVSDLDRSVQFFEDIFGFESLFSDERLCAMSVEGQQILLLFKEGSSTKPGVSPGGKIPPHDGSGDLHLAFSISQADLDRWQQRLRENNVAIESEVTWKRGGQSLYFRDPDHHLIELLTPGTWAIY